MPQARVAPAVPCSAVIAGDHPGDEVRHEPVSGLVVQGTDGAAGLHAADDAFEVGECLLRWNAGCGERTEGAIDLGMHLVVGDITDVEECVHDIREMIQDVANLR